MTAQQAYKAADDFEAEAPQPLLRETPPGKPYPLDALGPLQPAAAAMHDVTQVPPSICAQSVMGVAAVAGQALADVETLHGRAPASLFLLTVAQSGERKTTCDRLAMRVVREFEAELAEARRDDITAYRNRLEIWQARRAAILKTAKDDPTAARADLDALGPEPEAPLAESIVSDSPTVEAIVKHFPVLRPALGLFADDAGVFVGGHGMQSEHRLKTVASLSGLWDGSPVSRWRAGDGVAVFRGRRLSAHLMMQQVVAAHLLSDPVANGQGFLARFLLTEPPSAIGTRLRIGHDPASDRALADFAARIGAMLRRKLPLAEGTRNELDPPLLALASDARALLQAFALEVERAQAAGGSLETVRPFASKAAEHAARLAAVQTLYAEPSAEQIDAEAMAGSIKLATYYIGEAARLCDTAQVSAQTIEAERLRRWIVENWAEPFVSVTDALQMGPGSLRESGKVRALFGILAAHGWLIAVEGGAEIRGRHRREAWRIVRRAGP